MKRSAIVPVLPLGRPASKVPAQYRGLFEYLRDRYADTVVLSFTQIESLTDAALPENASLQAWWAAADADGVPSSHSLAWTEANRTARPNLLARNVVFERVPDR